MNRHTTKLVITGVLAAGAILYLARTLRHGPPAIDLGPYDAVGVVAANETAALLSRGGRVVLITGSVESPVIAAEVAAFRKTLGAGRGCVVAAVETVNSDPLSPAEFANLLQKHADAAAVVALQGFPEFPPAVLARLPRPLPKLVAVLSGLEGARQLFAAGADGCTIEKLSPAAPAPGAGTITRKIGNSRFRIIPAHPQP
jgi:hypothetical protein